MSFACINYIACINCYQDVVRFNKLIVTHVIMWEELVSIFIRTQINAELLAQMPIFNS